MNAEGSVESGSAGATREPMQLDKTKIAIRERRTLENLDLALHVLRTYAWPLVGFHACAILPLAVFNFGLIGWMVDDAEYREGYSWEDAGAIARYLWTMGMLVVVEAPLASVFATTFLGQAVFQERPRWRHVLRDVWRVAHRVAWCQLVVRGIGAYWFLLWSIERHGEVAPILEVFVCCGLLIYMAFLRAVRPFVNEIVLLERDPILTRDPHTVTIGRRSRLLHEPSSGELIGQWIVTAFVCSVLALALFGTLWFLRALADNDWWASPTTYHVLYPLSLWIVAGYVTVVRFLQYLDVRIRQEGWEVELRLKAEAARIAHQGIAR